MMNVLIIGKGVVGTATARALEKRQIGCFYHDPPLDIHFAGHFDQVDCALICVPTPLAEGWSFDLRHVEEAAQWLRDNNYSGLVGIRSTVLPGTCDTFEKKCPQMAWFSWPEFLRASHAEEDACNPCRVIVGHNTTENTWHLRGPIFTITAIHECSKHLFFVQTKAAEFVKLATNAIHATNVGLANELAELAHAYRLDWNAMLPPLADEHIPKNIHVTEEGGYGGSCLPKDLMALLSVPDVGLYILAAVHEANVAQRPDEYAEWIGPEPC